jgi:opacity protein-like surface antigen
MKQIVALAALACLLAAGSSDAQVVKQQPFEGKMVPGAGLGGALAFLLWAGVGDLRQDTA